MHCAVHDIGLDVIHVGLYSRNMKGYLPACLIGWLPDWLATCENRGKGPLALQGWLTGIRAGTGALSSGLGPSKIIHERQGRQYRDACSL